MTFGRRLLAALLLIGFVTGGPALAAVRMPGMECHDECHCPPAPLAIATRAPDPRLAAEAPVVLVKAEAPALARPAHVRSAPPRGPPA